jgi:glycosyltransferase involved in cell wall biosynthesis
VRVGLDARTLATPRRSGVEHYVISLVEALSRLEGAPEIIAYTDRPIADAEIARIASSGTIRTVVVRATRGWLRLALPWRMRRDRVDVAHFPSTILPFLTPCPAVVTVHDLAWLRFPEAYEKDDLRMQGVAVASAARAAQVIAVSEATARDLRALKRPVTKVTVVPLGISPEFSPEGPRLPPDAFPGAERLQEGYVLSLCRLQERKNLARLVEAYRRVQETRPAPPLVIAGAPTEHGERLRQWARELGIEEQVLFPGYIADDLVPALHRSATVVAYPSLYEGFGLPVLEAMACGTPVVTSNVAGTAEVAGEAALLVDPEQVGDLADALGRLLGDAGLRQALGARGRQRASQFTWERTARETVAVYGKAALQS